MTADKWWIVAVGASVILAVVVAGWSTRRHQTREMPQTGATSRTDLPDSAPRDRAESDERPHPVVTGPGNRLRPSEGDTVADPGALAEELDAYRAWLARAQRAAADHATTLSNKLAAYPDRDDARWCLMHQAIGRAGAYRTATDQLPREST